jgi:hypothetical protein
VGHSPRSSSQQPQIPDLCLKHHISIPLCVEQRCGDAAAQAAFVVASFDGINRVAYATGTRLDSEPTGGGADEIIRELGLKEFGAVRA